MAENCIVSIIIPTRNGRRTIGRCLESIAALEYPSFEVIVVNDGSTDDTADIAASFRTKISGLVVLSTPGVGPSAARNMAIAASHGDYIAFTDDDCVVARNWIEELLNGFRGDATGTDRTRLAAVGGNQLSPDDETAFGRSVNEFLKAVGFVADYVKSGTGDQYRRTGHNPTCNVMYARAVFADAGNFKEGLWPGEDVEFDRRLSLAGYYFLYNPRAVVAHYRPQTVRSFARMMYRYGKAQAYLVRHYGFFRKIHAEPGLILGYCALLWLTAGYPQATMWLIVTPMAAALLLFIARTRKPMKSFLNLFFLAVTIIAWNGGFAYGLADRKAP